MPTAKWQSDASTQVVRLDARIAHDRATSRWLDPDLHFLFGPTKVDSEGRHEDGSVYCPLLIKVRLCPSN